MQRTVVHAGRVVVVQVDVVVMVVVVFVAGVTVLVVVLLVQGVSAGGSHRPVASHEP
jgi:hypothetical protein